MRPPRFPLNLTRTVARSAMTLVAVALTSTATQAQAAGPPGVVATVDDLLGLAPAQLDALYMASPPAPMPAGKVKGTPLLRTGTALARPVSKGARAFWQGKVFRPAEAQAVNRFLGVKVIKGNLYQGPSWLDGNPALILDYDGTSHLYGDYRDEIRQVAPGLYLGLMFDRTTLPPTRTMYFALEVGR